jgi:CRP-like cAMP-binding protein
MTAPCRSSKVIEVPCLGVREPPASKAFSAADRDQLRAALRRVAPLTDEDCLQLDSAARFVELARGEQFLRAGDVATQCGTLLAGIVREHYPLADGREVTRGFAGPGDGVGSLSDLIGGEPSRSSVVAETDARIAVVPWATLRELARTQRAWTHFLARVTERLYLRKAEREYELLALDAAERYERFRVRYAALEDRIPLRAVASYVGITPEHLSRLRRRG